MIDDIKKEILKHITLADYFKGENFNESMIEYIGMAPVEESKRFQFLVRSSSSYQKYMNQIVIVNNHIDSLYCSCPQFALTKSCKHLAACLILYSDQLFSYENPKNIETQSIQLLSLLKNKNHTHIRHKEEVKLIPYLAFEHTYYRSYIELKVKIGTDKTYSFLSKASGFERAYENHESYHFGTNFIYDPDYHYFSDQSLQLLDLIDVLKSSYSISGNSAILNDRLMKRLLHIYPEGIYLDNTNLLIPIKNEFPVSTLFHKEGKNYELQFNESIHDIIPLTDDYEYVFNQNVIYHLNEDQQLLLDQCIHKQIDKLSYPEESFSDLQRNMIHLMKDQIKLDDTTKDIIIETKPEIKFYFDLNENDIVCIPRFIYQSKEISYFDNIPTLIRDIDYEENTIDILYDYGFHKEVDCFILTDFDLVCEFMDTGINEISNKYQVFTSEKIKDTKIVKNSTVSTTFHIGKDNILSYDFELNGVSSDELNDLLTSLKQKKKYYQLKNGNIVSLDNNNFNELNELTDDLELNEKGYTLPKYKALYIDSLHSKYHIIKTDSIFQNFIQTFNQYKETNMLLPANELKILRDYQVEGVKWLYTIYKCGFGGILADEMGLGKSIQTIYFLHYLLTENKEYKFLIVCPTSLVYNWENEFNKFSPDMKYHVFAGNKITRHEELEKYDGNVYITSYGLLREDLDYYQLQHFEVFIIDEAQNIKNPKTGLTKAVKSISANNKLALTGTPIENSVIELWSIFDFIMPGFLSNLTKFNSKYQIKEMNEDTNNLLSRLKVEVKPFILRRKKSDVIKELPAKIENTIYIDLTEEQKKIYAAEINQANDKMNHLIANGGFNENKMIILSLLTRLRQICIDPSIILSNYEGSSSKIENLIKIIKELISNGHKILVFTSFKTALNIVKNELDHEQITSYTIAGDVSSKKRQELVNAFNHDDTSVFLIMLKSGGTGINLTSADTVIHLDLWWNPQAENQATDRTHRIGQTKNVEVIKLVSKGTIEEKILDLQMKKKLLSDRILENNMDDSNYFKSLTEEDIRHLLSYENKE